MKKSIMVLSVVLLMSACASSPPKSTKKLPDNFLNGGCFELPIGEAENGSAPIACP